jgi:hypothetical protein
MTKTHTFDEHDGMAYYRRVSGFDNVEDRNGVLFPGMATGAREGIERPEQLLARL